MPASYHPDLKTQRQQLVANAIDAGTSPGYIEIGTANMAVVLATIPLNDPCGVVSGNELVLSGFPKSVQVVAAGEAAAAVVKDSNARVILGYTTPLTVGTSPSNDIQIASRDLHIGNTIIINSVRIVHA